MTTPISKPVENGKKTTTVESKRRRYVEPEGRTLSPIEAIELFRDHERMKTTIIRNLSTKYNCAQEDVFEAINRVKSLGV